MSQPKVISGNEQISIKNNIKIVDETETKSKDEVLNKKVPQILNDNNRHCKLRNRT